MALVSIYPVVLEVYLSGKVAYCIGYVPLRLCKRSYLKETYRDAILENIV